MCSKKDTKINIISRENIVFFIILASNDMMSGLTEQSELNNGKRSMNGKKEEYIWSYLKS